MQSHSFDELIIVGGHLMKPGFGGVKSFSSILVKQAKNVNPSIKITVIESAASLVIYLFKSHYLTQRVKLAQPTNHCVIGNLSWSIFIPLFPSYFARSIYLHGFGVGAEHPVQFLQAIIVDILTSLIVYLAKDITICANSSITASHFQGYTKRLIKVVPIPPSIALPYYYSTSTTESIQKQSQFLFIGRLVSQKNVHLLIDAFATALTFPSFDESVSCLNIVGGGPEMERVKRLVLSLPDAIRYKIRVTGALSKNDVFDIFAKSTHFVSLNPVEPYGITCIEAAVAGLHLITTPFCGALEQISKESVTLVESLTVKDVSRSLIRSLDRAVNKATTFCAPDVPSCMMFNSIFTEI